MQKGEQMDVRMVKPKRGHSFKHLAEVMWCLPTADGAFCAGLRFKNR
jgi:hypothetical protein